MRIVHIVEASATGTLAMAALCCNALVRRGHEVHFIYSVRDETPSDIKEMFESGVTFHLVGMGGRDFPLSVIKLSSVLRKINPDVVHLHSSFAGFVGRLAGFFCRRPRYFYSPHCISFMRNDIGWFKRLAFILFERLAALKKSIYLACSNSELQAVRDALPNTDVVVLENAVDLKKIRQSDNTSVRSVDRVRVITVGGIRPQKGFVEFAEIAAHFRDLPFDFIWIGDGDDSGKLLLTEAGVDVKGWLPGPEVFDWLASSDLYLSTALWEGMPVTLIESMAAGVPVVARNCAGNNDLIQDGKTGILFSETEQAVSAISDFLSKPEMFSSFSREAGDIVFERFSVGRFESELISIYGL